MASRLVRAALAACLLALATAAPRLGAPGAGLPRAAAEEDWRTEFDALCARTDDAMSLPTDELRALLTRCDALAPRLRGLDDSTRKVYSKRLQLCRDLFDFVLKSRDKGK